jgi:hypothetical protein
MFIRGHHGDLHYHVIIGFANQLHIVEGYFRQFVQNYLYLFICFLNKVLFGFLGVHLEEPPIELVDTQFGNG